MLEKLFILFAPLLACDRAIQKAVNAAAHFIMRRFGVGKGFVRYGIGAIYALCHALQAFLPQSGRPHQVFVHLLIAAVTVFLMHRFLKSDTAAEKAGLWSPIDNPASPTSFALRFAGYGVLAITVFPPFTKMGFHEAITSFSVHDGMTVLRQLTLIAYGYLIRTPPNPPPEPKRETVRDAALVPVPVRIRR